MEIGDLGNTEAVKSGGDARAFDAAAAGFQMRVLVVEIPDGQRQQREGGQQKDQQLFQTLFQDKSPPQWYAFARGAKDGGAGIGAGLFPAQGIRRAGGKSRICTGSQALNFLYRVRAEPEAVLCAVRPD